MSVRGKIQRLHIWMKKRRTLAVDGIDSWAQVDRGTPRPVGITLRNVEVCLMVSCYAMIRYKCTVEERIGIVIVTVITHAGKYHHLAVAAEGEVTLPITRIDGIGESAGYTPPFCRAVGIV